MVLRSKTTVFPGGRQESAAYLRAAPAGSIRRNDGDMAIDLEEAVDERISDIEAGRVSGFREFARQPREEKDTLEN